MVAADIQHFILYLMLVIIAYKNSDGANITSCYARVNCVNTQYGYLQKNQTCLNNEPCYGIWTVFKIADYRFAG